MINEIVAETWRDKGRDEDRGLDRVHNRGTTSANLNGWAIGSTGVMQARPGCFPPSPPARRGISPNLGLGPDQAPAGGTKPVHTNFKLNANGDTSVSTAPNFPGPGG